ncbi:hypothetical protein [Streptomyces sp. NPDC088812]|uniref:hypothetical protein n=1 Tax=Streptomyces sp. NPDC088812 TaxID=3365905 RepID=UPI0037F68648
MIIALIPVLAGGSGGEPEPTPSVLPSDTTSPSSEAPATPTSAASSASPTGATPTEAASTAPATYKLVYENQPMSLGISSEHRSTLDFDTPEARSYGYDEWDELKADAQGTGATLAPDLSYHDYYYGYLQLGDGRSAAQLSPTEAPATAGECARAARTGGFSETYMTEWKLPAKTVFCVVTDQGNIVRAEITGFVELTTPTRRPTTPPNRSSSPSRCGSPRGRRSRPGGRPSPNRTSAEGRSPEPMSDPYAMIAPWSVRARYGETG